MRGRGVDYVYRAKQAVARIFFVFFRFEGLTTRESVLGLFQAKRGWM